MKLGQIMTKNVVGISPEETVEAAARTLSRYNLGALPVCGADGTLYGMLTDRDLVLRCMASGRDITKTTVRQVMTKQVTSATADMDVSVAAHLMGRCQIRRLPVTENGKLCGMVGLGDLAGREDTVMDAADALSDITDGVSRR